MKVNLRRGLGLCILSLLMMLSNSLCAQLNHVNPINNYISFANESTHGLLIAHRILEGFNQEVNAFVDLQSNQLNFYGNNDLPKNLFEDPEHWFYDISPNDWYTIIKTKNWESPLKSELDDIAAEMNSICEAVNLMRFTMEAFIKNNDLHETINQIKIFEILNNCASLYDRYYEANDRLHVIVQNEIQNEVNSSSQKANYNNIQKAIKVLLESIRYGFEDVLNTSQAVLITEYEKLEKTIVSDERLLEMKVASSEAIEMVNAYTNMQAIPNKYKLYGPAYYYHNVQLISTLNRYGKGFVANANKILFSQNPAQVLLLEEPHYFKVILPKKEIPLEDSKLIVNLPSKFKERVVTISPANIQVFDKKVLLEIFDHRQEDGDIVSINFNGKWILKEKKLKKLPLKIIIELNEEGENYLLLHAENLGSIPPNTIAIRYYQEGIRKLVVLNSDMNQSEMIRFQMIEKE